MPFTLSHAVLAPVLSRLSRGRLPLAALAIGCMLPDLYRLFTTETGRISHLWSGQIYPNLMIGLGFCSLWYVLYRPMLYQLFNLKDPLPVQNLQKGLRFLFFMLLALLMGNATHLIWDGLTHVDFRTLILHDALSQPLAVFGQIYPLHFVLQILSSVLALPFLGYWMVKYCKTHQSHSLVSPRFKIAIWLIFLASMMSASYWTWAYVATFKWDLLRAEPYYFIGRSFNEFSQAFLLSSTLGLGVIQLWQQFFSSK